MGAVDDAWVDEIADAGRLAGTQRSWTDVALDEVFVRGEVVFGERLDLGGCELGFEPLDVDLAVAGDADRQRLDATVGVPKLDDDVLQRVGRGPCPVGGGGDRRDR